jgi:hypothetical protein
MYNPAGDIANEDLGLVQQIAALVSVVAAKRPSMPSTCCCSVLNYHHHLTPVPTRYPHYETLKRYQPGAGTLQLPTTPPTASDNPPPHTLAVPAG